MGSVYPSQQKFGFGNGKYLHLNLCCYHSVKTHTEHFSLQGKNPTDGGGCQEEGMWKTSNISCSQKVSFQCQFLFLLNPLKLLCCSCSQERQTSLYTFVPDTLGYIFSILLLGNHCRCAMPATLNGSVNLFPHVHRGNLDERCLCFLKCFSSL